MTHAMTCQQFEDLIPRLLDGDVEMSADMRAHADACVACRSLLADLKTIQAGAASLLDLEPQRDLWSGIAARIEAPVVSLAGAAAARSERGKITWQTAAIAATLLVALTTTITYQLTRRSQPTSQVAAAPGKVTPLFPAPPLPSSPQARAAAAAPHGAFKFQPELPVANNASAARTSPSPARVVLVSAAAEKVNYDHEIVRLRAIMDSGRTRLDPATVALLERNLRIIDSAIVQCQNALAKDPASNFLIESLNHAYQSKVKLLNIAAAARDE
jgi:hypothetical protein